MSDKRTGRSIAGQWTDIMTPLLLMLLLLLLLPSGSVRSQLALNAKALAPNAGESSTIVRERSGNVASRKMEPMVETRYENLDKSGSEALEKIVGNGTSQGSEALVKSDKLKLARFEAKEGTVSYDVELGNDSGEPTTRSASYANDKDGLSEEKKKDYRLNNDGGQDKGIGKKDGEKKFSLLNDTNVNYTREKKVASEDKEEDIMYYGTTDYKSVESTLESPTNLISSSGGSGGGGGGDEIIKGHESRVIKNLTMPKILSSFAATEIEKGTNWKILPDDRYKTADNLTFSNSDIIQGQAKDGETVQSPRARTTVLGTNKYLSNFDKIRDSESIEETSNFPRFTEITDKSVRKEYPYIKVVAKDRSNYSDPIVPESNTQEASALENTIGQREEEEEEEEEEKKIVVTESSSVVIDKGIREPSIDSTLYATSAFGLSSTESSSLDNETTIIGKNVLLSNTVNKVIRGNYWSTDARKSNNESMGNVVTKVVQSDENNYSSLAMMDGETVGETGTTLPEANGTTTTTTIATESYLLVQNSTVRAVTYGYDVGTTINIETEDKNVLKVEPFNMTEASTGRSSSIKSDTASIGMSTLAREQFITSSAPSLPVQTADIFIQQPMVSSTAVASSTTTTTTTSKVEYEFVELTESTVPQKYLTSTLDSRNVLTVNKQEFASSTSSPYFESSSTWSSISSSSPNTAPIEARNVEKEDNISASSTTYLGPVQDSTTILSTLDSTETEITTSSRSQETDQTTTVKDFFQTETNESTTQIILHYSINSTSSIAEVENSTETGRSVDDYDYYWSKTTIIPEISTILENSSSTLVASTVSSNLSIVASTRDRLAPTSGSPLENSFSSESPSERITAAAIEPKNWSESGSSSTSKNSVYTITVNATVANDGVDSSQEQLTSLVRIIFEATWTDVCPHLPALRQSLAHLLSSALDKNVLVGQIIFQKNPCTDGFASSPITTEFSVTTLLLYVVDKNGNLDAEMTKILPSLYSRSPVKLRVTIHSFQLVQDADTGNAIAVVVVSCVAFICLVLLAGLLFIVRKRQTRFNYGERCRPVSLDAYSLDSVSAYNSVRGRKGAIRASKRSYGNPTFEDSTATPSHPLNFAGLSGFCNEHNAIAEEFTGIPQVTARMDELAQGAEVKNRYANVVPLPETRVSLIKINNDPLTEYINASYVRGPKNATKYYIACQAPIESTVKDFWRMIWEQESKVVIMLTDLVENGVEKCAEYIPPSEVTDCHRLFGDYQVTLKKRETKEKYAISTLHLKNLEKNTFREIWHIWYLWPAANDADAAGLIAVLLEARALQRGGPGPVVVHCSPGTGRTGTLIALDLGIRQYEITRTVDVPRVVYTIRRDRAGAVQTKEQYAFIYKALNLYATKLAGGALES